MGNKQLQINSVKKLVDNSVAEVKREVIGLLAPSIGIPQATLKVETILRDLEDKLDFTFNEWYNE